MIHRTADEMKAFSEGYTLCYQQFENYLLDDTPVDKTLDIMSIITDTVNTTAGISHEPDLKYRQEEWIPCTERLPKEGQYVLCSVDRRDEINECRVIITMFQDNDFWHNGRIYAWRPLPEPLKKEEEE